MVIIMPVVLSDGTGAACISHMWPRTALLAAPHGRAPKAG
jgi:hypothetical protein